MKASPKRTAQQQLAAVQGELQAATAHIQALDEHTLAWQMRLAAIPAPTGGEQRRADAVVRAFQMLGCTTRQDSVGNVMAQMTNDAVAKSSLPPIVCMAHLDTVFEAGTSLAISRDGSHVICPGIGDNSRGLATMLTLARVMHDAPANGHGPRRHVEFVATVGEEGLGNLRGARAYFSNRIETGQAAPHAVLVLDGPGDQNIVHHALGSRRYRITFRGAGGHSWADFGAPNAVHAAGRSAAWLAEVPRTLQGRVALTVSGIGGGESMNAIPAHAWIEVDVRATGQEWLNRVDVELRRIVKAACRTEVSLPFTSGRAHNLFANAVTTFHSEISVLGERPCGMLSREHALVQLAQAASRLHNIESVSAIASTDANIPLSLGIPAISIGGGGTGGGAHTVHEWYDNTNGPRGVARAFAILVALSTQ